MNGVFWMIRNRKDIDNVLKFFKKRFNAFKPLRWTKVNRRTV